MSTSPSRSSRSTWFDIAGAETRSPRGEAADADAGRVLDRDEQRDLLGRDADLAGLAPQLPADAQETGREAVGHRERVDPDVRRIVNQVNDS